MLRADGVRGAAIQVAEDLVGYPLLTVPDVERRCGITYQTANQAVTKLVDHGLLRQTSEGNYNRVFASATILEVCSA
jgi:DNA-binding IclR family transcriptional regulator